MEELQRPPLRPVDEEGEDLTDMEEEELTQQIEKPLAGINKYIYNYVRYALCMYNIYIYIYIYSKVT